MRVCAICGTEHYIDKPNNEILCANGHLGKPKQKSIDFYTKELEEEVAKLKRENLQLLRMIGAITYKNDGRIRISKWLMADMRKHSIAVYDDLEKDEYVISVY